MERWKITSQFEFHILPFDITFCFYLGGRERAMVVMGREICYVGYAIQLILITNPSLILQPPVYAFVDERCVNKCILFPPETTIDIVFY